jgi:type 1 glutamine amidotransferase
VNFHRLPRAVLVAALLVLSMVAPSRAADQPWVVYEGGDGPGKGKHIVLVSGDEEYRSEETLPQLAKILATHHGFKCTVLFAIDPKDGTINPGVNNNIPGLEALKTADLMVIFTRFRNLPDDQMKAVVDYVEAGKPVIGLRTATHAFALKAGSKYSKWTWNTKEKGFEGGFGRQVLGETWVNHWGGHGSQSTRGLTAPGQDKNPILRGIKDGDIWGPTDVYEAHPSSDCTPLVLGAVLKGMKPDDEPIAGKKNEPMMPIAWTKNYSVTEGKTGRSFTTTMGASQDFSSEGLRRLLVNASYWAAGLEDKLPEKSNVDIVGNYEPHRFAGNGYIKGIKPADLAAEK